MSNEAWMTFFTVLGLLMVVAIFFSALRFVNAMRKSARQRALGGAEQPGPTVQNRRPYPEGRSDAGGRDGRG